MYTQADVADLPHVVEPAGAGAVRARHASAGLPAGAVAGGAGTAVPDGEEFNAALVHDLARGQDAVVLVIDEAGQAGLDPDQAGAGEVGRGGTSVASLADLRAALDGVDLAAHPLHVEAGLGGAGVRGAAGRAGAREGCRSGAPARQRRPRSRCAVWSSWAGCRWRSTRPTTSSPCSRSGARRTRRGLQTVAASGHAFHDGGANAVQELAFTLAAAVHHLRELEARGVDVAIAAPRIRLSLSVGTHFFLEIARLRAARWLWARVVEASGGGEAAQKLTLHARTSRFGLTVLDPHVNILRGTTEAMAAILGGVDSLCVSPFDQAIGLPDTFSRRIARNTHTILREESHLDLVADPAGGTWYVEALTAEIAEAAWELFQEIEAFGGLVGALQEGWVQAQVAERGGRAAREPRHAPRRPRGHQHVRQPARAGLPGPRRGRHRRAREPLASGAGGPHRRHPGP